MASGIKGEAVLAESSINMEITGGPNDWDLFLCLRGTYDTACFYLDHAVRIPPYGDYTTFFSGKITTISRANIGGRSGEEWMIEGNVQKGHMRTNFTFKATYDVQTRKGRITFSYKYPKYQKT